MRFTFSFWILLALAVAASFFSYGFLTQNKQQISSQNVKSAQTDNIAVQSVTDGDTLVLSNGEKIRLIGINAPEVGQPFYDTAKQKLEELVSGKKISLENDVEQSDQYGRRLTYLYADSVFVNLELIRSGVAVIETIPPNVIHVKDFTDAQSVAREKCQGIWEGLCHQEGSACVQISSINPKTRIIGGGNKNEEWVQLINTCSSPINLSGYLVKDTSASNSYTFRTFSLVPKQKVKLHSGCSTNTTTDLYWECPERTTSVWNDTGDHAYLFDAQGKLVSEMGY